MIDQAEENYIKAHSSPLPEALFWIEKQTHIRTNYPQMLSGSIQGQLLKMLVEITGARNILEIGTFTGYSACCMALGLKELWDGPMIWDGPMNTEGEPDGTGRTSPCVDTLEINDELEDLIREGWERAGVREWINLIIGDALVAIPDKEYDIAFIDANKRNYPEYYELVLPKIRKGGLIIIDDTLREGKLWEDHTPTDPQTQGLVRFNEIVASDARVETTILPLRHGLTLLRKL